MLTRTLVTAALLMGAVACNGNSPTSPNGPSPNPNPPSRAPQWVPATGGIVGDYQLTIKASSSCALPAHVMKRTYKAAIRAWVDNQSVAVDVTGGVFYHDWAAGFDGTREGDLLRFTIVGMDENPYGWSLAESINGTHWLTFDGTAVASIRDDQISGTLDGRIALREFESYIVVAECRATDHEIAFSR